MACEVVRGQRGMSRFVTKRQAGPQGVQWGGGAGAPKEVCRLARKLAPQKWVRPEAVKVGRRPPADLKMLLCGTKGPHGVRTCSLGSWYRSESLKRLPFIFPFVAWSSLFSLSLRSMG